MQSTIPKRRVKVKGANPAIKRGLIAHDFTYHDVAREAGVGWYMVWAVLNRRKRSDKVLSKAREMAGLVTVVA